MSENPFDVSAIRGDMNQGQRGEEECVAFCRSALEHFNATAKQVGTPVIEVEADSMAARAAGIAMGKWPTVAGKARYYRILVNRRFGDIVWTGGDGRGLTQTEDGQFYFEGETVDAGAVAVSVAKLTAYDTDQARQVFESALRGEALSYG